MDDLGPTVEGQAAYSLPEDFLLPVAVSLAGQPLGSTDRATVQQFERGGLILQARNVWYELPDDTGLRKLAIYPVPGTGSTLELEWVFEGAPLKEDVPSGTPSEFPNWFHPKLLHFAGEIYYETVEDNPELAEQQKAKADLGTSELIRYDNERGSGDGIFQVGVAGVTA